MRIVFMGSAEFSCISLQAIVSSPADELVAVVTQPDRPKGRHLQTAACPAKQWAEQKGIPVLTPARVNQPEVLDTVRGLRPDLFVVVAYGQILKRDLLNLPPLGCINVHASLLPRYRGAAPITWAIANGDPVSGVTTMVMNERMDEGDILLQQEVPISPEDTGGTLHDKLAGAGGELLRKTLEALRQGTAKRIPQDSSQATLARKLTKEDGRIDWTKPAGEIYNRIRAFNPWPVCWCCVKRGAEKLPMRVWSARAEQGQGNPGEVREAGAQGILVSAGSGAIRLLEVQAEGGKRMSSADFLRGHPLQAGVLLESL